MEAIERKPGLASALVAAQKLAEAVEKDARNNFHNYAYASAEAIIAEARSALSAAGLAVLPLSIERDSDARDHVWMGEGDDAWISQPRRIKATYRLLHESGESMDFWSTTPVIPEKGRPEDKAEFGARTENLGYALRDLLLLPRVKEEIPSGRDDRNKAAPRPPAQPAARPSAAPQGRPPAAPKADPPVTSAATSAKSAETTADAAGSAAPHGGKTAPAAFREPGPAAAAIASAANDELAARAAAKAKAEPREVVAEPEVITAEQDVEIGALFKRLKFSRVAATDLVMQLVGKGPAHLTRVDGDKVLAALKEKLGAA